MYLRHLVFILALVFVPGSATADSHGMAIDTMLNAASVWTNQSGSTASLTFTPSSTQPDVYNVSGTYVNRATGFNCQGTPFPLSGVYYVNTYTISFSVAWSNSSQNCASVTGWTGYIDPSSSPLQMITLWNLAYSSGGGGQITQGKDVFRYGTLQTFDGPIAE